MSGYNRPSSEPQSFTRILVEDGQRDIVLDGRIAVLNQRDVLCEERAAFGTTSMPSACAAFTTIWRCSRRGWL